MFVRAILPVLFLVGGATALLPGPDGDGPRKDAGKPAAFERFKQLAGEWVGKAGNAGQEVRVQYKVTSGGTAVVETIAPGTDHEMVTVIHPDGTDLLLTHYCMLGNQPQMKASGTDDGNQVEFKFVRATNLKSAKAPHMHDVTFTFVDKDTLRTACTHYNDGKAGPDMVFELKRKPTAP